MASGQKWVSGKKVGQLRKSVRKKVGLRSISGSKVRKLVSGQKWVSSQKVCLKSKSRSQDKKWVSGQKWV